MSFLQTTFKTGYITDLILPAPPEGKTPSDVLRAGLELALSMAQSPEQMSRLNPFVYSVERMSATDPQAVDVRAVAAVFGVNVNASFAAAEFVHYEIKDKVPVVLGYSADLTYHSAIRPTIEGIEALTNPGSGVLLHGMWMVKGVQGAGGVQGAEGSKGIGGGGGVQDVEGARHASAGNAWAGAAGGVGPRSASAERLGVASNGNQTEAGAGVAAGLTDSSTTSNPVWETGNTTGATPTEDPHGGSGTGSGNSGMLHLLETNTIQCSIFLAWYIRASMDKAHRTAHRRFKELWTQKMKEKGYPSA